MNIEDIAYFELKKELPGVNIGTQVVILPVRSQLTVNGIDFPIDFGLKFPDWFKPITHEEHAQRVQSNFPKI